MEEQKTDNPPASIESVISNFTIRTMEQDLRAGGKKSGSEPTKVAFKIQTPLPEKPAVQQINSAEILAQAKNAYGQKLFEDAIALGRKILQEKSVSWLTAWRTKSLINKAQKELNKKTEQPPAKFEPIAIAASPAPSPAPIAKPSPPPLAPKITLPEKTINIPPQAPAPIKTPPVAPPPPVVSIKAPVPPPTPTPPARPIPAPAKAPVPPPISNRLTPEPPKQKIVYQPSNSIVLPSAIKKSTKPETLSEPANYSKRSLNLWVLIGMAVIVAVLALLYFILRPNFQPTSTPQPQGPVTLFSMERQEIVDFGQDITSAGLISEIKSHGEKVRNANQFTQIIIRQTANGKTSYPSLSLLFNRLNIFFSQANCPDNSCPSDANLLKNIDTKNYSLFLYGQNKPNPASATPNYSIRFGLVAKLTDPAKAKQILNDSEAQLPDAFYSIFLEEKPGKAGNFTSANYNGVEIRSASFTDPSFSLNYAVLNDLLLITASKESALAALEQIFKSGSSPPAPIIKNISQTITINGQSANQEKIISEIKDSFKDNQNEVAKLLNFKITADPEKYANLDELTGAFNINLPPEIKNNTETYNLIAYFKPARLLPNKQDEIRLVLVLKQKDPVATAKFMPSWEPKMVNDLTHLLLIPPGQPTSKNFTTRLYHNGSFRYISLPDYTLTINYTILSNHLIIGTSRESIFYVYDQAYAK